MLRIFPVQPNIPRFLAFELLPEIDESGLQVWNIGHELIKVRLLQKRIIQNVTLVLPIMPNSGEEQQSLVDAHVVGGDAVWSRVVGHDLMKAKHVRNQKALHHKLSKPQSQHRTAALHLLKDNEDIGNRAMIDVEHPTSHRRST